MGDGLELDAECNNYSFGHGGLHVSYKAENIYQRRQNM